MLFIRPLFLANLALGNILIAQVPAPTPKPEVGIRMTAAPSRSAYPVLMLQSLYRRDVLQQVAESANSQVLSWANSLGSAANSQALSIANSVGSSWASVAVSAVSVVTSAANEAMSSASSALQSAESVARTATGVAGLAASSAVASAKSAAAAAAQTATVTQNAAIVAFGPPSFTLFGGLAMYASLFLIFLL